ncbi:unnamed protein product [Chondrus crispus]|uniref:Uncharacterized protein n=1 Tax=Chondrus crispus TaxID=2769 RepID=R7QEE9_CHOCR|nr:unnamed protein product [Chondrus crispus]CDF35805.1 unnamed protein product [Chondrus crispus]|eukprot:XP_005715624.1 unnamed protein product [Chondrus crispus]
MVNKKGRQPCHPTSLSIFTSSQPSP